MLNKEFFIKNLVIFSSLTNVLCYTKIIVITPRGSWQSCKLRKIGDTELNFLTIKSSRPEVFCEKGVLKNLIKVTEKNLCQGLMFKQALGLQKRGFVTVAFLSILQSF